MEGIPRRLADLGEDLASLIALVCRTERRSAKAAALLAREGFARVRIVQGGMTASLEHGRRSERNPSSGNSRP